MITIPTRVQTDGIVVSMNVGADTQNIGMGIGGQTIAIPMKVQTEGIVVPAQTVTDTQSIGMGIGAKYAVAGAEAYDGTYEVIPKARQSQTLETKNKLMEEDVFIFEVPYFQTSNEHGDTVYIASEV